MSYNVVVQSLARSDLQEAYGWAAERAPLSAERWLDRFERSLERLAEFPDRCSLARENGKVDVELREFLFGKKPYVFRVIFTIDGQFVRILRIRRAQRRFLTKAEIEIAIQLDD